MGAPGVAPATPRIERRGNGEGGGLVTQRQLQHGGPIDAAGLAPGQVDITLRRIPGGAQLPIDDHHAGVPDADPAELTEHATRLRRDRWLPDAQARPATPSAGTRCRSARLRVPACRLPRPACPDQRSPCHPRSAAPSVAHHPVRSPAARSGHAAARPARATPPREAHPPAGVRLRPSPEGRSAADRAADPRPVRNPPTRGPCCRSTAWSAHPRRSSAASMRCVSHARSTGPRDSRHAAAASSTLPTTIAAIATCARVCNSRARPRAA